MKYNKLGNSDIEVSAIALGCMTFTGDSNWGPQIEKDSIETVRAALDAGITLFDTAESYADGYTEEVLGRALGDDINNVVISSKVSEKHLTKKEIVDSCDASLKRLGRDYIDIYHIHWPNADSDLDEVMQTLLSLKQSGKIREIGVSNFGKYDIEDILKYNCVVSNQMPYNMLWRSIEYDILPMCIDNNIGVLTYSSLAQGLLTGKYKTADDVPVGRARTRIFSKERPQTRHGEDGCEEEAFAAIEALRGICDEIGQPMNRVAISWLIHRKGISSVVAGARTAEQAKLNAAAADIELSEDIIRRIDSITEKVKEHIGKNPDPWDCRVRY